MLPDSGIAFYTNSSSVFMKQRRLHLPHLSEFGFQFWSFLQDVNQDQNPNSSNMLPTNRSCPQNSSASSKLYFLDSVPSWEWLQNQNSSSAHPLPGPPPTPRHTHCGHHTAVRTPRPCNHAHAATPPTSTAQPRQPAAPIHCRPRPIAELPLPIPNLETSKTGILRLT